MENLRIGIVGNIGVGKSTLIEHATRPPLSDILLDTLPFHDERHKVLAFPEEVNPVVLDAFYDDPVANAFLAQIEFFNSRYERQKKIDSAMGIVLEDRVLHEDYFIFGLAQKVNGHMSDAEFQAYQRTFSNMVDVGSQPDLIVYLKADVPVLQERIRRRGRDSERGIPSEYLKTLNELYEQFVSLHVSCPVLVVDANDEEPDIDKYSERVVKLIADKIRSLDLRVTTPGISEWVLAPQTEATERAIAAEQKLESYLLEHPALITVAGNVGLGKTSFSRIMERSLRIRGSYENPLDNPLLEKFLRDKPKYCFELQKYFLKMRASQRRMAKESGVSYVKDRSLPEDLLVFSYQFNREGLLSDRELERLIADFKATAKELPSADLMVILRGSPELAWNRIVQRGIPAEVEGGWTPSQIRALDYWYGQFVRNVREFGFHDGPIVEFDLDKLMITDRIHIGYMFERIYDALQGK